MNEGLRIVCKHSYADSVWCIRHYHAGHWRLLKTYEGSLRARLCPSAQSDLVGFELAETVASACSEASAPASGRHNQQSDPGDHRFSLDFAVNGTADEAQFVFRRCLARPIHDSARTVAPLCTQASQAGYPVRLARNRSVAFVSGPLCLLAQSGTARENGMTPNRAGPVDVSESSSSRHCRQR
jgi:hypothetical protein